MEQDWTTVQTVEYAYDYNNVWIRKTIGNNKTIFIPENYQTTVQIDNNVTTHHYLWTPNQQDKLLADTTSTDILWSLTDHLGTVRDILGATATHLIYDAFGNLTSGTNPLLFGYTGKAFDSATKLQNNINRWYDATIGRWLSTDPIGFNGNDTNLYRYVKNKCLLYCDSIGLAWYDYTPIVGTVINAMFQSPGQDIFDYMDNISLIPSKEDCCNISGEIEYKCAIKIFHKMRQFLISQGVTQIPSSGYEIGFWGTIELLSKSPQMPYKTALRSSGWVFAIDGLINIGLSVHKIYNIMETSVQATDKFCRCP